MSRFNIEKDTAYYRYSTRKFKTEKIEIEPLQAFAKEAVKLFDDFSYSVFFIEDGPKFHPVLGGLVGNYGKIIAPSYAVLMSKDGSKEAMMGLGFLAEQIVLKATELQIQTCYIGSGVEAKNLVDFFEKAESYPYLITIALGKEKEKKAQINRVRKSREALCAFANETVGAVMDACFENVRQAPSALNGQPYFFDVDISRIDCYSEGGIKAVFSKTYHRLRYVDLGIALFHIMLFFDEKLAITTEKPKRKDKGKYVMSLKLGPNTDQVMKL